jgi:ribose transport system substrate-binding protein
MKLISFKSLTALIFLLNIIGSASAQEDPALFLENANAKVARAMAFKGLWDGPTSGPKLAQGKFIAFIGADLGDPSELKLANSLKEVAASVGWSVQVFDCFGVPSRRADAFSRAMALKPAGIIFADADAKAEAKSIGVATDKKNTGNRLACGACQWTRRWTLHQYWRRSEGIGAIGRPAERG